MGTLLNNARIAYYFYYNLDSRNRLTKANSHWHDKRFTPWHAIRRAMRK